jgi:MFS transporter, putative metabolite:H+ symporter
MPAETTTAGIVARMERIPPNGYLWRLIGAISLGAWFEFYDIIFIGAIAPGLAKSGLLQTTTDSFLGFSGIAGFIAITFLGLFLGTFFLGQLSDRFGRRRVYTAALVLYSAASAIMAFQTTGQGLLIWRLIAGIGIGVQIVTVDAFIVELAPASMRGKALGFNQALMFTAMPVAALLSAFLVPDAPFGFDGWRWVVLIGAVGALFAFFILRIVPETPRWLALHGRMAEAEAVMARIEAEAVRRTGRPLAEPVVTPLPVKPARASFAEIFAPEYRTRVGMLVVFNFFQAIGYYGFVNWVPTLLIAKHIVVTKSLVYTSIMAVASPIGPLLSMAVADRVERKWLIVGSAFSILLFGSLFALAEDAAPLIAMGVMINLSNSLLSVCYHSYQNEIFPTRIRARAAGLVYSFSRLGAMSSGFLVAALLKQGGPPDVFVLIGGCMIVVMLSISIFGPVVNGRRLEEIAR